MRIATICARMGSKGVPGKNLLKLGNKTLVALATEQALNCSLFDYVIVSSDGGEIINEAMNYGATHYVNRPKYLSGDNVSKPLTIVHAVKSTILDLSKISTIVDLDVTSPLRNLEDIIGATKLLESNNYCSVLTGSVARRNPYFNLVTERVDGSIEISIKPEKPILSRQLAPKCYDLNASVHVWNAKCLITDPKIIYENTHIYQMPQNRSLDIDSEVDLAIVRFLYEYNK